MKNKLKVILGIIVGIIIGTSITVYAYNYQAKDIGFTPTNELWEVDNVEDAINELYSSSIDLDLQTFFSGNATSTNKSINSELSLEKGRYVIISNYNYQMYSQTGSSTIEDDASEYTDFEYSSGTCNKLNSKKLTAYAEEAVINTWHAYDTTRISLWDCNFEQASNITLKYTANDLNHSTASVSLNAIKIK